MKGSPGPSPAGSGAQCGWIMMKTSQSGKGLLCCGLGALIAGLLPTLSLLFVI